MKRILHVVAKMNRGGAEAFIMNCYRKLDRSVIQFDFLVNSNDRGDYDDEIEQLGGRIFRATAPFGNLSTLPSHLKQVGRIARTQGPFAALHVHIYLFSGLILYATRHSSIPLKIMHIHTTQDGVDGSPARRVYRSLMKSLIRRHATHFFSCSEEAFKKLFGDETAPDSRLHIVRNGIDAWEYLIPPAGDTFREQLKLPANGMIIGHVGRFEHPKNQAFLVEVFQQVAAVEPRARLVFVGDGSQRPQVESQVQRLGLSESVIFAGLRTDVNRVLAGFDVFAFPSFFEGVPLALVEAQAAGVPCVISDAISCDVDIGLGLIQRLSLKAHPSLWADAILRSARQPRLAIETRRDAMVQSGYEISSAVREVLKVYGEPSAAHSNKGIQTDALAS